MIKKFKQFIINEISGTELVGNFGPAYGQTGIQNKTLDGSHSAVIYCDLDGNFYTHDTYNDIYNNYLKSGGKPLIGFSLKNIETILQFK
jgi:hypothetical protein